MLVQRMILKEQSPVTEFHLDEWTMSRDCGGKAAGRERSAWSSLGRELNSRLAVGRKAGGYQQTELLIADKSINQGSATDRVVELTFALLHFEAITTVHGLNIKDVLLCKA